MRAVLVGSDGKYITLPEIGEPGDWLYNTTENIDFDYYPDVVEDQLNSAHLNTDSQRRIKKIYIQSTARAGSRIVLFAGIDEDSSTTYYSENIDEKVEILAEGTPSFSFPEDYNWIRRIISVEDDYPIEPFNDARFIYEYALSPKYVRFSHAQFNPDTAKSKGMIRWQYNGPTETFATHVGVALPNTKTVHYNNEIQLGAAFPPRRAKEVVTENAGMLVVLLQGDNQIPYYPAGTEHHGPLRLDAYDKYGTLHNINIDFDLSQEDAFDKRTNLVVSTQSAQSVAANFVTLEHFQVKGFNSERDRQVCPLYNNGHQQTYIDVVLFARNEKNEPVQIDQAILDKVELVNFDNGAALGPSYTVTRTQSDKDKSFVYHPSSQAQSHSAPAQGGDSIRFWIRTTSKHSTTIAARLIHDGVTYHTYQRDVATGGKTVSGKSNSAAVISPLEQDYFYRAPDFDFTRANYNTDIKSGIIDVDLYTLKLKSHLAHYIAWNLPASHIWTIDYIGSDKTNMLAFYQRNNQTSVTLNFSGVNQPMSVNGSRGVAHVARIKRAKKDLNEKFVGIQVHYLDQYGNRHYVWFNPGSEANTINIT
ncbi:hypothetical protein D3C77_287920 [compost metagenome]